MNKQSKSLGKRSTNTASLSNAISSIKTSISPVITTGRARSNPLPLKANNEIWLSRKVRIFRTVPTTSGTTDFSLTSAFSSAGIEGQMRVLGLTAWNYTSGGNSTGYVALSTPSNLTETAVTTSVNDIGTGTSLPGVKVTIPRTIASNLVATTLVGSLCNINVTPDGVGALSPQQVCLDVHFEYKTDVSN